MSGASISSDQGSLGIARLRKTCAALSHDLNNYVGIIQGYAELARLDLEGQEDVLGYLDCILEGCQKVTARAALLENLAESRRVTASPCDLNEQLALWAKSWPEVQFKPESAPVMTMGDPGLLEKVFHELYLNARESSPQTPPIRLTIRQQEGWIVTVVEDEGSGLADGLAEQIFDPYVSSKGSGRGFGLCWVRGWLGRMGGRVEMSSRSPLPGTQVTVWTKAIS